jgi:hypothetical protein
MGQVTQRKINCASAALNHAAGDFIQNFGKCTDAKPLVVPLASLLVLRGSDMVIRRLA